MTENGLAAWHVERAGDDCQVPAQTGKTLLVSKLKGFSLCQQLCAVVARSCHWQALHEHASLSQVCVQLQPCDSNVLDVDDRVVPMS